MTFIVVDLFRQEPLPKKEKNVYIQSFPFDAMLPTEALPYTSEMEKATNRPENISTLFSYSYAFALFHPRKTTPLPKNKCLFLL